MLYQIQIIIYDKKAVNTEKFPYSIAFYFPNIVPLSFQRRIYNNLLYNKLKTLFLCGYFILRLEGNW